MGSGQEEAAVAVAEEAELMVESVAVAVFPGIAYQGRHEQQECALGLVEICYQTTDNMVFIARGYHQLGVAVKVVKVIVVHPLEHIAVGLLCADLEGFEFVGVPLQDVHGFETRVLTQLNAEPVD